MNSQKKVVDVRGLVCPQPVIMTKRALREIAVGDQIVVVMDSATVQSNVEHFLRDNGAVFTTAVDNNVTSMTITKGAEVQISAPAPAPAASVRAGEAPQSNTKSRGAHCVVCRSDRMGDGPEDLGKILLQAFINTLAEVSPLPSSIVLYNTAVLLACEGSPLIPAFKKLEQLGVSIMVCGTCTNYFDKSADVRAGTISNMYTILEVLTDARSIIYP